MHHHPSSRPAPAPAVPLVQLIGRIAEAHDVAWQTGHSLAGALFSIMEAELRVAAEMEGGWRRGAVTKAR